MADDLPIYLLLAVLLAIPFFLSFFATRRAAHRGPGDGAGRLPPGPWALPVIGHLHHLAGALPHRALRDLARRHGPLMALRLGELPVAVSSSPEAAREVMRTHDAAFASRPLSPMQQLAYRGAEGVIFAPYGEGWRRLRGICALELLSARRVQSFRAVREDEAGRLLRAVAAAAAASPPVNVNLSERMAAYVADSTVRAIIGSRFEHRDAYLRMLQEGLKIVPGMTLPDLFPSSRLARLLSCVPAQIESHRRGMQQFIDTIIAEHRESRASGDDNDEEEDLLDVLLRLQKEVDSQYPLTTENIKTVMLVISSDFLININNILILLLLNLETNSFTGHVWRRQRDVGDDAAVGDGGADAKPKSDAEGPGRGPASPRRPRQGDRG
jgi:cytochrome P450